MQSFALFFIIMIESRHYKQKVIIYLTIAKYTKKGQWMRDVASTDLYFYRQDYLLLIWPYKKFPSQYFTLTVAMP